MRYTILLLIGILTVSGCGIKPTAVDAPQGAEHDTFPRTYPAPLNNSHR
jgi:hypothetical protein